MGACIMAYLSNQTRYHKDLYTTYSIGNRDSITQTFVGLGYLVLEIQSLSHSTT